MSKQLLTFLTELANNNSKEWMDSHRLWFLEVRECFLAEVSELLTGLVAIEPGLETLSAKDCVFRQNRDIRFSSDKRPYKNNFAAYFAIGGKKSTGPGYYVHVQPGASFLAGGIWMPPADTLKKIRQEIDYSGDELEGILNAPLFKRHFSGLEGEKLKTSPRDYPTDHPHIDYLRFKSFEISKPVSDTMISNGAYKEEALRAFETLKPFNDFLAKALDDVEDGSDIL